MSAEQKVKKREPKSKIAKNLILFFGSYKRDLKLVSALFDTFRKVDLFLIFF